MIGRISFDGSVQGGASLVGSPVPGTASLYPRYSQNVNDDGHSKAGAGGAVESGMGAMALLLSVDDVRDTHNRTGVAT